MTDKTNTPPPAPATIQHLLREALNHPLATSNWHGPRLNYTYAYEFPKSIPGMEKYVLVVERATPEEFRRLLEQSTALVPLDHIVAASHIGQPLMTLQTPDAAVSIRVKQEGESLNDRWRKLNTTFGDTPEGIATAYNALAETVLRLQKQTQQNPLISMLDTVYRLGAAGYKVDLTPGNLLVDDQQHRIALVDQLEEPQTTPGKAKTRFSAAVKQLKGMLTYRAHLPTDHLEKEFAPGTENARHQLEQWVDEAAQQITARYAQQPDETVALRFAKVHHTSAISLQKKPHTLLLRLNQLAADAGIPGFTP